MSWLDVVTKLSLVAASASVVGRTVELQQRETEAVLQGAVLQQLRNQIFAYKQVAEELLITEDAPPKHIAAIMKLSEQLLAKSGLTPDLFTELYDKEYVASTSRCIRMNSRRLVGQLQIDDQREIEALVSALMQSNKYAAAQLLRNFFGNDSLLTLFNWPENQMPTQNTTSEYHARFVACPKCGLENTTRVKYCEKCGARLPER